MFVNALNSPLQIFLLGSEWVLCGDICKIPFIGSDVTLYTLSVGYDVVDAQLQLAHLERL